VTDDARVLFLLLAARKVGSFLYAWGGESADEGGFDCSGFVSTCLTELRRHYPAIYDGQRRTADGLFEFYRTRSAPIFALGDLRPGALAFYPREGRKTHIAIHACRVPPIGTHDVGPIAFEAGGSGSAATSPRAALMAAATIRMTATDRRLFVALDPFRAA
jgi:hypothetical protein